MSITTKTGDRGQTSLYSGERVWKDDLRVDAYGSLDELDAHIGDTLHLIEDPLLKQHLDTIQNKLYRVMGELATPSAVYPYPILLEDVEDITTQIHHLEKKTPLKGFVLPGSTPASAKLDICRTIARRAERRLISLSRSEPVPEELLQYVNRLSDLFFMLARTVEAASGAIRYIKKPGDN